MSGTRQQVPAVLARFVRERQWQEHLGIHGPPPSERDWQEAEDYELIMDLIDRRRRAEAARLEQYRNRA